MGSPPKKPIKKTTKTTAAKAPAAKKPARKTRRKKAPPEPGSKGPAGLASRSKPALAKKAAETGAQVVAVGLYLAFRAAKSAAELERELRDALATTLYVGTSEIQRNLIAGLRGLG